jgi:hypothetical protein
MGRPVHRLSRQFRVQGRLAVGPRPGRTPAPALGATDLPGPQGVSLHVPADAQKMLILLDRKAPKAAPVKVPAPAAVAVSVPAGGA